jgi:sterol desaturase/sphingolipid hydroxylase (fatty acid hydroxylase superfamily)
MEAGQRGLEPSSGVRPFVWGEGRIAGYTAAALGLCALLGVLCFRYPEWLTTAEFRASLYSFGFVRNLLWLGVLVSFLLGMVSYLMSRDKRPAMVGMGSALGAVLLGAFTVEERAVDAVAFSFGLDWFVLAFVFSMIVFVPLEKAFAQKPLQVLRPEWRTDLTHFAVSHLLVQFVLLFTNAVHEHLVWWAQSDLVMQAARSLPVWLQFIACVFVADLLQSLIHRAYHEWPWLWRFHAVHHSSRNLDWLAGSRMHFLEALATRTTVIVPLYLIGFSQAALNAYVVLVGVQAVFVHANVNWNFGLLRYVLVTPRYHHWHHSDDPGPRQHQLRGASAPHRHAHGHVQAAAHRVAADVRRHGRARALRVCGSAPVPVSPLGR